MLFRDNVLRAESEEKAEPTILEVLRMIILEQIAMDRAGSPIDTTLAKACIAMLEGLYETEREIDSENLYLTCFEREYLSASRDFYEKEGASLLRDADAATYCRHTTKRIDEETDRCRSTLSESTTAKITKVLEGSLIQGKIKDVIYMSSGVPHMIDNDRLSDLELVYQLNSRIDSKKTELTQAVQRRIQEVGNQINETAHKAVLPPGHSGTNEGGKEQAKPKAGADKSASQQSAAAIQWVEAVLHLKDKYDKIWKKSFQSDNVIQPAVYKSFTESINDFPRCSEFISLFIDENMKKGLKDKSGPEIDSILDKAIVLIRYITDKDMFERYYKKHLCKRLLMQKSLSIENEHDMIRKMKIELGNSFVQKLENMFKDMQLSDELTANYRQRVADSGPDKRTDLSIHVLTSMTWPLETMQSFSSMLEGKSDAQCIYPSSIDRVKRGFENFYGEKHSGRQLTWMPHMGTADIRVVFPAVPGKDGPLGKERKYDLNVSTYGMLILMLFNDLESGASLSFDEIQARTNIGQHDLVRNLQSLAVAPKTRVLVKEPMSKDVKSTDRFFFNDNFHSNFFKIKIGVVAGNTRVEGERERKETERRNNDSRSFAMEAAVVRIMKYDHFLCLQSCFLFPIIHPFTAIFSRLFRRSIGDVIADLTIYTGNARSYSISNWWPRPCHRLRPSSGPTSP